MKRNTLMLSTLSLSACQNLTEGEAYRKAYYRERATTYEQSSKTNLEDELKGDLNFGIVIIDMQEPFLAKITAAESSEMIAEQKKSLQLAKEQNIPVIVFEYEGNGETIPTLQKYIEEVPRHIYFTKSDDDGFAFQEEKDQNDSPSAWLKENKVNALYFEGVNGSACVLASANSAYMDNFTVATSNQVIATGDQSTEEGYCPEEQCNEAKSSLLFFLQNGILDPNNQPFLDYLAKNKEQ